MKRNFSIFILSGLFLFTGCSQFELTSNRSRKRVFQVNNSWVRQTTEQTNLGFRKINRFQPLLYTTKKKENWVIQANALDGVTAYDRLDGQLKWRLEIVNGVEASAVLKGDTLYVGGNDGQFYSVDPENGAVRWSFPTRMENLSEPLVENGMVFVLTGSNSLYALDAKTGKQLWLYSRPETSSLSIRGGSKPAYKDGTIFTGFSDGAIVALNAGNGSVKWERQLSRNKRFRDLDSNPLVDGEVLYILGYDDAVYALRVATGDSVWRFEKGGYGGFLMIGERLYFASTTDEMISLDKSTGRQIWAYPVKNGIATSASLMKGVLVFGESAGSLRFVESGTGREIGHFEPGRGIFSPAAIDEKTNRVYFISNEANLYELEAKWDHPAVIPYLR